MHLYIQRSRLVNSVNFIDWGSMLPEEFNTSRGYKDFNMDNLARFVLRARIVQDHSLAQDIGALKELSEVKFRFNILNINKGGGANVTIDDIKVPHTEQIESAAARVRYFYFLMESSMRMSWRFYMKRLWMITKRRKF